MDQLKESPLIAAETNAMERSASMANTQTKPGITMIRIATLMCSILAVVVATFLAGRLTGTSSPASIQLPPEFLNATATHGGADMAIATGQADSESEAIYFLDFKTGDLTCYVYYPRFMRFGAKYVGNVTEQLPATKNAEYLMVTGQVEKIASATNARPALSLVYVVDTKSGQVAAYTIAPNPAMENAGQLQGGKIICVGVGEVRTPSAGSARGRSVPNAAAPDQPANGPANAPEEKKRNKR